MPDFFSPLLSSLKAKPKIQLGVAKSFNIFRVRVRILELLLSRYLKMQKSYKQTKTISWKVRNYPSNSKLPSSTVLDPDLYIIFRNPALEYVLRRE
jgi:hypothetical protein